jgi:GNAT superfamily N-acetyltransferase
MRPRIELVARTARRAAPRWPAGVTIRQPEPADRKTLAALMLDTYRGTIDDDGETLDDARSEIDGYLAGAAGAPALDCSFMALVGPEPVSACLVSMPATGPLIAYEMTAARWKGRGLASSLLALALSALAQAGQREARLWVTVGNTPAERIYRRFGFRPRGGGGGAPTATPDS